MSGCEPKRAAERTDRAEVKPSEDRIVVLSDTHLGKPRGGARSAAAMRPLWQGARSLIVNGDLAEIHDAQLRGQAAREVEALHRFCEADGVELLLISGNHDAYISDCRYLSLFDGEVFITHGDVLHPAIAPWGVHAEHVRTVHEEAIRVANEMAKAGVEELLDLQQSATQHAAMMEWEVKADPARHPRLLKRCWSYARMPVLVPYFWYTMPRKAAQYAQFHAPRSRFFLFGHIHHAGIWNAGARLVINTGSFGLPWRPRGVIIERGRLAVWPIEQRDGHWAWGGGAFGVFPLHRASTASRKNRETEAA